MKYFAPTVLPRDKWFQKGENVKNGDLVLELNPNRRRTQYEDGANYKRLPQQRQFGQEGAHQDPEWRVRLVNP